MCSVLFGNWNRQKTNGKLEFLPSQRNAKSKRTFSMGFMLNTFSYIVHHIERTKNIRVK